MNRKSKSYRKILAVFLGLGLAGCGASSVSVPQAQVLAQMESQKQQNQRQQQLLSQAGQGTVINFRDYQVGPEDLLEVQVFGHDNLNRQVRVNGQGIISLPLVGEVYAWQYTFFIVGALGLPIALLMLTIREPLRRAAAAATTRPGHAPSSWPALRSFLGANRRLLSGHIVSFSLFGLVVNAYLFWAPSFMIRTYGFTAPQAGRTLGLLLFVVGTEAKQEKRWLAVRLLGSNLAVGFGSSSAGRPGRKESMDQTAGAVVVCGRSDLVDAGSCES